MKTVLTTGCPHSGWEGVLRVLYKTGLNPVDDTLDRLHQELYPASGTDEFLQVSKPFSPDDNLVQRISAILSDIGNSPLLLADNRNLWLLDFWADSFPEMQFLLFYTSPSTALAHGLYRGLSPKDHLKTWRNANQELIRFQNCHRGRAILLDAESAVQNHTALIDTCQNFGLKLNALQKCSQENLPKLAPLDHLLVANLAANKSVQELNLELEARAQPLGDTKPSLGVLPDGLFESYQKVKTEQKQMAKHVDENLKAIQELENNFKETKEEKAKLANQVNQKLKALQELENYFKETKEEKELILFQLHKVQEELESTILESQKLRLERDRELKEKSRGLLIKTLEVEKYVREIQQLKQTPIWKFTKPFRYIGSTIINKKTKKEEYKQIELIRDSGFFDTEWYLSKHPDVGIEGFDPVEHYFYHGAEEGRNPSTMFDTNYYLDENPDVFVNGTNPLLHYIKYGKAEGRETAPKHTIK